MKTEMCVIDVPLGAIQSGPIQFIKQQFVSAERDLFELTLPGQISRCGGSLSFAVKSIGRIVIDTGPPDLAATVSAQISDEPGLSRGLEALLNKVGIEDIANYAVRLASRRSSFADVVEQAEAAVGGCGCDCGNGVATLPGSVSVGFSKKPRGRMMWSDPVRAMIKAQLCNGSEFGPIYSKRKAVALGPNATACLSIWHGLFDRWTECKGPCSSGTCCCRKTSAGTPVVGCDGWVTCTCQ